MNSTNNVPSSVQSRATYLIVVLCLLFFGTTSYGNDVNSESMDEEGFVYCDQTNMTEDCMIWEDLQAAGHQSYWGPASEPSENESDFVEHTAKE